MKQVNDPMESIEFTQNDLETKVSDMEKKIFTFEIKMNEMYDYQVDLDYANDSLPELQDRSRRNNILVDGVTEKKKRETWEGSGKNILEILRYKLEIEDVKIERSHRVKPYQNKKKQRQGLT